MSMRSAKTFTVDNHKGLFPAGNESVQDALENLYATIASFTPAPVSGLSATCGRVDANTFSVVAPGAVQGAVGPPIILTAALLAAEVGGVLNTSKIVAIGPGGGETGFVDGGIGELQYLFLIERLSDGTVDGVIANAAAGNTVPAAPVLTANTFRVGGVAAGAIAWRSSAVPIAAAISVGGPLGVYTLTDIETKASGERWVQYTDPQVGFLAAGGELVTALQVLAGIPVEAGRRRKAQITINQPGDGGGSVGWAINVRGAGATIVDIIEAEHDGAGVAAVQSFKTVRLDLVAGNGVALSGFTANDVAVAIINVGIRVAAWQM